MTSKGHGLLTIATWVLTFVIFTPVLLLIVTAFKTEVEAVQSPPSLVFEPTLDNIVDAINSGRYEKFLRNSLLAVSVSTVLAFVIGIPAAYALAFYPGRRSADVSFWVDLHTLHARRRRRCADLRGLPADRSPRHAAGADHSVHGHVDAIRHPHDACVLPRHLARDRRGGSHSTVPRRGRILWSVITPLSKTGIAAAAILVFIFAWNELFLGLMLTRTQAPTLPVFLASLQTSKGLFWAQMSAAALLSVWPAVLLGWLAQRNLTRGLTMGAVK